MEATSTFPLVPWSAPQAVFDRLEGTWQLARTIAGKASMHGHARFERLDAQRLKYREEGQVRLADGQCFDGHREYLFQREPNGFSVFFAEDPPRLFHGVALAAPAVHSTEGAVLAGSAGHLCLADHYDSRYLFFGDGSFAIVHTVRGPHKAYISHTRFTRQEAC